MSTLWLRSLICLACTAALSGAAFADQHVRGIVEELNTAWDQAFNRGDAGAVAAMYREDAVLSPGNGETLKGRQAIEQRFRSAIDNGVRNHRIEIVEVQGEGDLIYEVARWSAEGSEKDGMRPRFTGVLVNVFERGPDGKWQSRSHLWNAAPK